MSLGFKTKFDQMRESNPARPLEAKSLGNYYEDSGYARTVCFVWPDGRKIFLSYSYMIYGEYNAESECIHLVFTSHDVLLKGSNLDRLYGELMQQLIRFIIVSDSRYQSIAEENAWSVHEIEIKKHEN